jgi:hypothetical protein
MKIIIRDIFEMYPNFNEASLKKMENNNIATTQNTVL